jgi:glycosyltransferase involved in cell wall biosynthesis
MNILFASYGGFDCNSSPFIAAYANELAVMGHDTAIAVASRLPNDLQDYGRMSFCVTDHATALQECPFADGGPADIVHAWTPREAVRRFCVGYAQSHSCRVVVHMEDNEEQILSTMAGRSFAELVEDEESVLDEFLSPHFAHPRRYKLFLDYADAATVVWPSLVDFLPANYSVLHLPVCPPVLPADESTSDDLIRRLGLSGDEKILVYSGGVNAVNLTDQSKLYEAVVLLNQRGVKCRLLRTGPSVTGTAETIFPGSSPFITEVGLVSRAELASVMRLAHVFVQPGSDDEFNRYRLPCKIPEFLAIGCPMILPRSNFGATLRDGEDALLLEGGSAEEIAIKCATVFEDESLRKRLAARGKVLAEQFFDLRSRSRALEAFYLELLRRETLRKTRSPGPFTESVFLGAVAEQARGRGDAKALERVADQLGIESGSDPVVHAEIHLVESQGDGPSKCIRRFVYKEGVRQSLELPALHLFATPLTAELRLRLYPVNGPREFVVHRLDIVDEQTSATMRSFRADDFLQLQNLILVEPLSGVFLSCADGANLTLPDAPMPADGAPCKLVIEITTRPSLPAPPSSSLVIALADAIATRVQLRRANRHITEIESSRCWKVTAPYRRLAGAWANLRRSKGSGAATSPSAEHSLEPPPS